MRTIRRLTLDLLYKFSQRNPEISTCSLLDYTGISYGSLKTYERVTGNRFPRGVTRMTIHAYTEGLLRGGRFDSLRAFLGDFEATLGKIKSRQAEIQRVNEALQEISNDLKKFTRDPDGKLKAPPVDISPKVSYDFTRNTKRII